MGSPDLLEEKTPFGCGETIRLTIRLTIRNLDVGDVLKPFEIKMYVVVFFKEFRWERKKQVVNGHRRHKNP